MKKREIRAVANAIKENLMYAKNVKDKDRELSKHIILYLYKNIIYYRPPSLSKLDLVPTFLG